MCLVDVKMVQKLLYNQESSQDEKWISLSTNTESPELCRTVYASSSILQGFESICSKNSIFLDIKWKKSRDKLSVFDHTRVHMNLSLLTDLAKYGLSNFSSKSYKAASLCNFPINMTTSMNFLIESLGQSRRSRSMNNLAELIKEYTLLPRARNLVIGPPVPWSFDTNVEISQTRALMYMPNVDWLFESIMGSVRERTPMKGHLHFKLGIINDANSQNSLIPLNDNKQSDFSAPATSTCRVSPTQLHNKAVLFGNQASEMKSCEEIPTFHVDTNLTNSYDPTPNANFSMMKGQIKCQWKSGNPYFIFIVDDGCSEVYLSRPCKIKSSVSEGLDYMYLFHSKSVDKLDSENYDSDTSNIIGKMKVSNFLTMNSDDSRARETQFVLYSGNAKSSLKMQISDSIIKKSKRLCKKVTDKFRLSYTSKHKSTRNLDEFKAQFDILSTKHCLSMFRNYQEEDLINQVQNDCTSDLELAAVILKDNQQESKREAAIGGWGLKFLGRSTVTDAYNSSDPSVSSVTCKENQDIHREKSSENLTVLVPAGYHGGPSPSGIIKRWRSGGHCDCGGWDLGCPLRVLSCGSSSIKNSRSLFKEEQQDDSKLVDLFPMGTKKTGPIIKMVDMNDGLYIIYFHPSLSALQIFSIGVAIIHAQSPALAPH
ncbi:hypothetical protein Cni_G28089 [Canna indica]|uniref:Uncharacterized protein n=1 Tax=Canna indica TaxID=4628 RepID=A0AAQ3QS18_9LILI|nr:hypothetical protein Cni_G28089 [Canna indica]